MSSRAGHWIGCYSLLGLIATLACSSDVVGPSSPSSGPLTPTQDENGPIAFTSCLGANGCEDNVFIMNPDGSAQTQLTAFGNGHDRGPAISPDGTKIAFASDRDGNFEIYVMNLDGSGQTRLTFNSADDEDPAWSPDGTRIAFESLRDGLDEVYVMNADGSGQTNLTNNPAFDSDPAWSPDGTRIAFESSRDGGIDEIYVMNADGTSQTRLTIHPAEDEDPAWSPDGSKIAFESARTGNDDVFLMNPDGSAVTNLTNNPEADSDPSWSPDGTKIAFDTDRDGNDEIYVMNIDGSGQINLTNRITDDFEPSWGRLVEVPECSDSVDNDDDGLTDFPADPGCASPGDTSETTDVPVPECSDTVDNDGDGLVDFPADPGCTDPTDPAEFNPPQCSDAIDNDGDGLIDSADPGCVSEGDNTESPNPPPPAGNCAAPPTGGNVLSGRSFLGVVLFVGTEGDDVAVGVPGQRNIFLMRGGNDTAVGAELQDAFHGGEGNDTWCGDGGSDAAFGGPGSDNLTGLDGFDRNDGGHTPVPSSSVDQDTDVCFGEANFLCEQSSPDGVVISSIRFKQDVRFLLPEDGSFLGLRPAVFRYREPYLSSASGIRVGLIAEEVARTYPAAVVYEADGGARGIRYDVLSARLVDRAGQVAAENLRDRVAQLAAMVE